MKAYWCEERPKTVEPVRSVEGGGKNHSSEKKLPPYVLHTEDCTGLGLKPIALSQLLFGLASVYTKRSLVISANNQY